MVEKLWIEHASGRYPIEIGTRFASTALTELIGSRQVCVVTNTTVSPLYLAQLQAVLPNANFALCELPDGEEYKTCASWLQIQDTLIHNRCGRDAILIALGGGVVGDLAGFAAACYQRGMDYVHIPTTLLSQVDSSIGGKTAINHPAGKNLIGAFWQPKLVLINTNTLNTLPEREFYSGFAEIIKAGILASDGLLQQLESQSALLLQREPSALQSVIRQACEIKQQLIGSDERDLTGKRALLNLGHTFAHALESYLGYGEWLHGEAVGLGLVLATAFAVEQQLCSAQLLQRVKKLVACYHLPTDLPTGVDCAKLVALMALDKKIQQGKLRIVLPHSVGHCELTADYSMEVLQAFLQAF